MSSQRGRSDTEEVAALVLGVLRELAEEGLTGDGPLQVVSVETLERMTGERASVLRRALPGLAAAGLAREWPGWGWQAVGAAREWE